MDDDEDIPGSMEVGDSSLCSSAPAESLYPSANDLPSRPAPAVERNYTHYFVTDFLKEQHDQYIYRHDNGLCVIGLAPSHIAFEEGSTVAAVDFNVGKKSRVDMKATGKRKTDACILDPNSALCKVITNKSTYIVRCCVKGALLEVNERLLTEPSLLESKTSSEGYIAILMPKSDDWKRAVPTFLSSKQYTDRRLGAKEQTEKVESPNLGLNYFSK